MCKLRITPAAASDWAEINGYISTQLHNPQAARRIVKIITHDLRLLQQNPQLGFSVSAKIGRETNLQALLSGNYFLFCRVENEMVQVSRVLAGRQDYLRILFFLSENR